MSVEKRDQVFQMQNKHHNGPCKGQSCKGQSLVEYLLIVALVAIVGVAAFKVLGVSIHTAAVESVMGITNNQP